MSSIVRTCVLLLVTLIAGIQPVLARSYLNCLTRKVVIVDAPKGSTSSNVEEHMGFRIDEAAKTVMLANGTALTVRRFDEHWISATHDDTSYDFDRQNGNLSYATTTMKNGTATITIGSGRCEVAAGSTRQRR